MPFSETVFFDRDPGWGVYTRDGQLVQEAAYSRGEDFKLVGQSRSLDLSGIELEDAPFDEMVYGGVIVPHFGHFVIASLARFHALDGKVPALFHSQPQIFDHALPYIRELIAAAGLTPQNCASFTRPKKIKRLIVPEAAFVEQARVSPAYTNSIERIGNMLSSTARFTGERCYISKTQLPNGIAGLGGEDCIERAFAAAGFQIVYPERMNVAEQVGLFRHASVVVGTVGSAFHTVALVPSTKALRVIFSYGDAVNSNFQLVDFGVGGRSLYFSLRGEVEKSTQASFLDYHLALDPEALAARMVAVVNAAAKSF